MLLGRYGGLCLAGIIIIIVVVVVVLLLAGRQAHIRSFFIYVFHSVLGEEIDPSIKKEKEKKRLEINKIKE